MGFKLALNLGLEIGTTKLALSLAEKNLTYVNPLKKGGGGLNLTLNLTLLNIALNLSP
jgi:hypothetical protein